MIVADIIANHFPYNIDTNRTGISDDPRSIVDPRYRVIELDGFAQVVVGDIMIHDIQFQFGADD